MNADGKIYIVITDKMPDGARSGLGSAPTQDGDRSDGPGGELLKHWARDRVISTTKHAATSYVMYTLENIGNFTGDYITQTHINDSISNLKGIMGIGSAALAGFTVTGGNPIGAVIGATLSVINTGVSSIERIHSARVQNRKVNYEIEQLRDRVGMNAVLDGSRGTEN